MLVGVFVGQLGPRVATIDCGIDGNVVIFIRLGLRFNLRFHRYLYRGIKILTLILVLPWGLLRFLVGLIIAILTNIGRLLWFLIFGAIWGVIGKFGARFGTYIAFTRGLCYVLFGRGARLLLDCCMRCFVVGALGSDSFRVWNCCDAVSIPYPKCTMGPTCLSTVCPQDFFTLARSAFALIVEWKTDELGYFYFSRGPLTFAGVSPMGGGFGYPRAVAISPFA